MPAGAVDLDGRVALVTGGGRGIGRTAALRLAEAGARVMAVSRSAEELERLAAGAADGAISVRPTSLATPEGCREAVRHTREVLGPIDVLVCNAGIGSAHERPIWEQDPAVWHETMAVNLHAPFELMRLAAADMRERGWGRIIVVSSTAGLIGSASESAYDASKHGVIGLVRSVALDLAPFSVTCNAVCPGWVRTKMADVSAAAEAERRGVTVDDIWAERARGYAAGRVVAVEEVGAAILFLASPQASGISGQAISVALGDPW